MKNIFTCVFILFLSQFLSAQSVKIEGTVYSANGDETLAGATVAVFREGRMIWGTSTDATGDYSLELDDLTLNEFDLVFSYVGYEDLKVKKIEVKGDENILLDAELKSGVTLETVVVSASGVKIQTCCICCGGWLLSKDAAATEKNKAPYPAKITITTYPNPVTDYLNFDLGYRQYTSVLFNAGGQAIAQTLPGISRLDVSKITPGAYFLSFFDERNQLVVTEKVMIVR